MSQMSELMSGIMSDPSVLWFVQSFVVLVAGVATVWVVIRALSDTLRGLASWDNQTSRNYPDRSFVFFASQEYKEVEKYATDLKCSLRQDR